MLEPQEPLVRGSTKEDKAWRKCRVDIRSSSNRVHRLPRRCRHALGARPTAGDRTDRLTVWSVVQETPPGAPDPQGGWRPDTRACALGTGVIRRIWACLPRRGSVCKPFCVLVPPVHLWPDFAEREIHSRQSLTLQRKGLCGVAACLLSPGGQRTHLRLDGRPSCLSTSM